MASERAASNGLHFSNIQRANIPRFPITHNLSEIFLAAHTTFAIHHI